MNPTSTGTDFNLFGNNGNIRFDSRAGSNSYINTGNVGIGTTSPGAKLDIVEISSKTADYSANRISTRGSVANSITTIGTDVEVIRSGWSNSEVYAGKFLATLTNRVGTTNAYGVRGIAEYESDYATSAPSPAGSLTGLYSEINLSYISGNAPLANAYGVRAGTATIGTGAELTNYYGIYVNSPLITGTLTNKYALVTEVNAGNVGIGTTTPSEKLQVNNGKLYITESANASTANLIYLENSGSGGNEGVSIKFNPMFDAESMIASNREGAASDNANLTFHTALADVTTERMRITSSGNVGIGTTAPEKKLHVAGGDVLINNGQYYTAKNNTGANYKLAAITTGNQVAIGAIDYTSAGTIFAGGDNVSITTGGVAGSSRLKILSNGNVGIGTTNPATKLDVRGDITITNANGGNPTDAGSLYFTEAAGVWGSTQYGFRINQQGTSNYLNFQSANTTTVRDILTLARDTGNVGIGTTSPSFKLEVTGNAKVSSNFYIGNVDAVTTATEVLVRQSDRVRGITPANLINASGGPYLPLAGGTMTGTNGVLFPDNFKLNLGSNSDLQIYHDGSNSRIKDVGTGDLLIDAANLSLRSADGSGLRLKSFDSGTVKLYHGTGANEKLATTATGITVTGTATATTFSGDLNGTINTVTTAVTKPNATDDDTVATTAFVKNLIETIPAGLVFQGTWNADTNTPTLANGTGTTGHFYIVSTEGSTNLDGITDWKVGDWAVFVEQGATDAWEKVDNSSVLDGSGTGQTVALWGGSGTSNTLTDAPITVSSNNTTFAGNVTTSGNSLHISSRKFITRDGNGTGLFADDATSGLSIADNGSATFTGDVSLGLNKSISFNNSNDKIGSFTNGDVSMAARNNIGIYADSDGGGDGVIDFHTGDAINAGSPKMTILNNGNVGIGTTSPGAKLTVRGSSLTSEDLFHIEDSGGVRMIEVVTDPAGNASIQVKDTTGSTKTLLNSSGNSYLNGGNVGIGTTSPSSKLQVSADNGDGITLQHGVSNAFYILRSGNDDTIIKQTRNYTSKISISTLADSGTHESSGLNIVGQGIGLKSNIGIGTASPSAKLHLADSASGGNPSFILQDDARSGAAALNYILLTDSLNTNQAKIGYLSGLNTDLTLQNLVGSTSLVSSAQTKVIAGTNTLFENSGSESMRIDSSGNVGIGTTSPADKLDILNGNLNIAAGYYLKSGTRTSIMLDRGSDARMVFTTLYQGATTGGYEFSTGYSGVKFLIQGDGNVGIGTTSPSAKLDIEGDLQVKGVNISNQENLDVDTGTETIATVAIADYDAAFFDYVIKNGTDLRAGTVFAVHNGTSVEFTETSTSDLGNTSRVTLSVDISGADMRLRATATSDDWIVKSLVRAI